MCGACGSLLALVCSIWRYSETVQREESRLIQFVRSYPLFSVLVPPATHQMAYVPVIDLTATDSEGSTGDSDSDVILGTE